MRVFTPVLRQLAAVDSGFSADGVNGVFLLEQQIARIGDVAEYLPYGGVSKVPSLIGLNAHPGKLLFRGFS